MKLRSRHKSSISPRLAVVASLLGVLHLVPSYAVWADSLLTSQIRQWPDNLFGVEFINPSFGVISGYAGTILRTTDGGASWQSIYIGTNELIRRVTFVDTEYGWAVGHRGSISHSADGGVNWSVQHRVPDTYLRDVHFVDRKNGWAVGHESTIVHTTDGGASWRKETLTGFKGRDLPRLHAVFAISKSTAIIVGEFGVIARTVDGGASWHVQESPTKKTLLDVAGNGEKFLAVGLDGTVLSISAPALNDDDDPAKTTVELLETDTAEHFLGVASAADAGFLAVGRSVVALIGDNGVVSLKPDANIQLPFTWFGGVDVLDDGTFWMGGIRGAIARGNLSAETYYLDATLGRSEKISVLSNRWSSAQ